jgi:hypothetical protein
MTLWSVGRIRSAISELFSRVGQEIKVAPIKKKKQLLLDVIDRCHIKAEIIPLTTYEREEMKVANDQIAKLRRDGEMKRLNGHNMQKSSTFRKEVITPNTFI